MASFPILRRARCCPTITVEAMEEADAIVGGRPADPNQGGACGRAQGGSLLGYEATYDLYANLRPIGCQPALADLPRR